MGHRVASKWTGISLLVWRRKKKRGRVGGCWQMWSMAGVEYSNDICDIWLGWNTAMTYVIFGWGGIQQWHMWYMAGVEYINDICDIWLGWYTAMAYVARVEYCYDQFDVGLGGIQQWRMWYMAGVEYNNDICDIWLGWDTATMGWKGVMKMWTHNTA